MKSYDILIIGAGSIGTPLAYNLAKKGKKVCVIEMNASSIFADVPTTGKVLGETSNIATVCIHYSEVAVSLQQGSRQLTIGVGR